jgi:hypothetical protein
MHRYLPSTLFICFLLTAVGCGSDGGPASDPSGVGGKTDEASGQDIAATVKKALDSNLIGTIGTSFPEREVQAQIDGLQNEVSFKQALRAALQSFRYDGREIESPVFLAHEDELEGPCAAEVLGFRLSCLMNDPDALLAIVARDGAVHEVAHNGGTTRVYPPEEAEAVSDSWVFYLKAPQLSDHLFWAVVQRKLAGGKVVAYNYGFN